MLTPYIGPIGTSAKYFPLIGLLVLVPLCLVHYWRFGTVQEWRALVFYSLLFYLMTAFFLVVLPLPEVTEDFCAFYRTTKAPRLVPFAFVGDILDTQEIGVFLQAFFNFLLLLPLGFYLRYYFRLRFWRAMAVSFGATLFFELTQLSALYGLYPCPYRVFDVDDLILNTAGAALGYGMTSLLTFLPDLRQQPEAPTHVTWARRLVAFRVDVELYFIAFVGGGSILWLLTYVSIFQMPRFQIVGAVVWFIMIPALWRGYTPGKRLAFLRMVNMDGKPAAWWRLLIRYGVLWSPLLVLELAVLIDMHDVLKVLLVLGFFGFYFLSVLVWSIFRKDARGLHDMLAGTRQIVTWRQHQKAAPRNVRFLIS